MKIHLQKYKFFIYALTLLHCEISIDADTQDANAFFKEEQLSNGVGVGNKNCSGIEGATKCVASVASVKVDVDESDFEQIVLQKLQQEQEEENDVETVAESKLLSRKRRYLIFPEGSSFQVVWDGIIGVVDYTNYLILGVTVALAWELPSKPPGEMIEDIETRLKQGTFGLRRNDTASNVTYVATNAVHRQNSHQNQYKYINFSNTPPNYSGVKSSYNTYYTNYKGAHYPVRAFHPPMHHRFNYYHPNAIQTKKADWSRKDYYYSRKTNPLMKWTKHSTAKYPFTKHTGQYPWWNLASRISNSLRDTFYSNGKTSSTVQQNSATASGSINSSKNRIQYEQMARNKQQQQQPRQQHNGYYQSTMRKHRIYPVFGKRKSLNANNSSFGHTQQQHQHHRQRRHGILGMQLSKLDRIHIRYHRSTRQELYGKIERYLEKRVEKGQSAHHCVLRALCETGQKSEDKKPGSFLGELMRAIFTLPEPEDEDLQNVHYKDALYDTAHAYDKDCTTRFHLCKDSLWESKFII